uniref:Secreted protein n=1 Tax=Megaselia scalaris TaxID=36166 RepID=T1H089_MEGSC
MTQWLFAFKNYFLLNVSLILPRTTTEFPELPAECCLLLKILKVFFGNVDVEMGHRTASKVEVILYRLSYTWLNKTIHAAAGQVSVRHAPSKGAAHIWRFT